MRPPTSLRTVPTVVKCIEILREHFLETFALMTVDYENTVLRSYPKSDGYSFSTPAISS